MLDTYQKKITNLNDQRHHCIPKWFSGFGDLGEPTKVPHHSDYHIRAIILSGALNEQTATQAPRLGACHCLAKSFEVGELRVVVRRALNLENE